MILAWLMVLLCLNLVLKMLVFISDKYTFCILSASDTVSYLRLFSCVHRQFIFSLLSVYYPYLKPWAICINSTSVYFDLFSGYFRYMILHLYVFINLKFSVAILLFYILNIYFHNFKIFILFYIIKHFFKLFFVLSY